MPDNYCSQCGQPVTGNFCANCGKPLGSQPPAQEPSLTNPVVSLIPPGTPAAQSQTPGTINTPLGSTNPVRLVVIVALVLGFLLVLPAACSALF